MSHDLVAVQRDAALIDDLARRARTTADDRDTDPVVSLLAALAADVDEGLLDAAFPVSAARIPEQGRRDGGTVSVLPVPVPVPAAGRRHVARAVAASVVVAAMLSVTGVAAAVSGDPLTPYKRVVDVVRGGYHDVMPTHSVVPPKVKAATAKTKARPAAPGAVAPGAAVAGGSRAATPVRDERRSTNGRDRDRQGGDRQGWDRQGWDRHDRASRHRDSSSGRDGSRSGRDTSGRDWTRQGERDSSDDSHDSGGHGDGSRDSRR